jgi:hypothetical protein
MSNAFDSYQNGGRPTEANERIKALIRQRFGFHPATETTGPKHEKVRHAFIAFADLLFGEIINDCDAAAVEQAMDKLQEAAMWSNFAVALKTPVVKPKGYTITNHNDVPTTDTSGGQSFEDPRPL